jgi:hypothetical protein
LALDIYYFLFSEINVVYPYCTFGKIAATELLEHAVSDDFFEISNKIAYDRALAFFSVVS